MFADLSIVSSAVLFVAGAFVIILAGSRLPLLARAIAPRVGLGETAVGLFVLAVITSLPELAVTLSAMRFGAPDLALGNVLGSNNFNLAVAGFLSLLFSGRLLAGADSRRYTRTGLLLVASTALTGVGVIAGPRLGGSSATLQYLLPPLLFSVPILVMFIIESRIESALDPEPREASGSDRADQLAPHASGAVVAGFVALAAAVVAAGVLVSWAARNIAVHEFEVAGGSLVLGETFVGTLLVAIATSLPEVTVAFSAMRKADSPDMAMGTLLGSNSFNLLVFALGAPLMAAGPTAVGSAWSNIRSDGNPNLWNIAVALVITLLILCALNSRRARTVGRTLAILAIPVYLAGLYAVYATR